MAIGAGAMRERPMNEETNPLSVPLAASNSLFRNILPISPLNSKILREFLRNSLIPKDRDKKIFVQYRVDNQVVTNWNSYPS
jgi:hypothetical protein